MINQDFWTFFKIRFTQRKNLEVKSKKPRFLATSLSLLQYEPPFNSGCIINRNQGFLFINEVIELLIAEMLRQLQQFRFRNFKLQKVQAEYFIVGKSIAPPFAVVNPTLKSPRFNNNSSSLSSWTCNPRISAKKLCCLFRSLTFRWSLSK